MKTRYMIMVFALVLGLSLAAYEKTLLDKIAYTCDTDIEFIHGDKAYLCIDMESSDVDSSEVAALIYKAKIARQSSFAGIEKVYE